MVLVWHYILLIHHPSIHTSRRIDRVFYSSIQHILFVIAYRKYFNIYWQQQINKQKKKKKENSWHDTPKIYSITESNEFLNNGHFLFCQFKYILFPSISVYCTFLCNQYRDISGKYSSNRQKNLLLASWSWIYKTDPNHRDICLLLKWKIRV